MLGAYIDHVETMIHALLSLSVAMIKCAVAGKATFGAQGPITSQWKNVCSPEVLSTNHHTLRIL